MKFQKVAIPKVLREAKQFFSTASHSRTFTVLTLLLLVAVVPLTVYVGQQNQDLRQEAATAPEDTPEPPPGDPVPDDPCDNPFNIFCKKEPRLPQPVCSPDVKQECCEGGKARLRTTFAWTNGTGKCQEDEVDETCSIDAPQCGNPTPQTCDECLASTGGDIGACEIPCASSPPQPTNPPSMPPSNPRGGPTDLQGECSPATDKEPYPQECTTSDGKTGAYLVTVYKWTKTNDVCKYDTTECKTQSSNPTKSNCSYGTTCPDGKPTECKGVENTEGVCKYDDGIGPQCTPLCDGDTNPPPSSFNPNQGDCPEGKVKVFGECADPNNSPDYAGRCSVSGITCTACERCLSSGCKDDPIGINDLCKGASTCTPDSQDPNQILCSADTEKRYPLCKTITDDNKLTECLCANYEDQNTARCGGDNTNNLFCEGLKLVNLPLPDNCKQGSPKSTNTGGVNQQCTELLGIKFCACDFFPNNPECKSGGGSSSGGGAKPGIGGTNNGGGSSGGGRPGSSSGTGNKTGGQPAVWKCDPAKYGTDGRVVCNGFDECKDKIGKGNPDCDKNYGTGGKYQQVTKDYTDFQKKSSGGAQTASNATCAVTTSSTTQDPNRVTYVGLGGTVRLWARAKTPVQDPANTIWPFKGVQTYGNEPAYELDECSGSQYPPCGNTFNVSVPTGDYTFFCDVTNTPNECSGDTSSGKKACSDQNSKPLSVSQTSFAGTFKEATCQSLKGWVRNPQDTTSTVKVEFFVNKASANNKDLTQDQSLGQVNANTLLSDLAFTDKNHGFVFTVPDAVKKSLFSKKRDITAVATQETNGKTITTNLGSQTITCGTTANGGTTNAAEGISQDQVKFYLQQIGDH